MGRTADANNSYRDAIKFGFRGKTEHIAEEGIGKPHANNNRIERLNGTVRKRVKVQRGWKTLDATLAEGQRIHYNFVKPHFALGGQTPAERARVGASERLYTCARAHWVVERRYLPLVRE